ncbi:ankyrin repeat and MYND domain-containing protein 2-like [Bolinopsis microptera]|uniref:ankyrin repeat and MYND domain-containing protein 2-like n=1 Tax=Bolinopsis microptera TaxID=2820187 RepID=UPI00307A11DA
MDAEFLQLCKDGDADKVSLILKEKRANVNVTDSDGMSGLMHAAYNGHTDMCSLLLDQGAEVDKETTKDYFTALMLATLAGRGEVVELLLRAGANPEKRNKLDKNAANMAAFVGSKECLRIINNFLPLSELLYHTVPRGLDKTDFLPPDLAPPLHYLCCMTNLNPVKMLLYVKDNPAVANPANKVQINRVLDRLIDKQFKEIINEVIAFKMHYITCLLEEVHKRTDGVDGTIRYFLLGRKLDGFPINVEQLVRRAIRTFKFVQSQLVMQLVRTIAAITPGAGKPALYFVMTTLNGRHVDVDEFACRTCGEMNAEKRCSACKQVFYCNATCQKMHWFTHKKVCESLSKRKPKCQPVEEEIMMPPPPPPQLPPSSQPLPSQPLLSGQLPPPQYPDNNNNNINNFNNTNNNNNNSLDQKPILSDMSKDGDKSGDHVTTGLDHVLAGPDHVMAGSEFLVKLEPQGAGDFPKSEPGVNVVVKEEVLDSNIIPTS